MDPKELEKLTKEFEALEAKIAGISGQLNRAFIPNITAATNQAKDLTDSFGKGVDITKKLDSEMRKLKNSIDSSYNLETKLNDELAKQLTSTKRGAAAKADVIRQQIGELQNQRDLNTELEYNLRQLEKSNIKQQEVNQKKKDNNNLSKALNDLQDKFNLKQIQELFTLTGLFKVLIDAGFKFSKISTEIGKNLGYGADNANRTAANLVKVSQDSSNINVTLQNAAEAMNEISTSTGYVAEYSADALETQIMLTKQFGLQAEEAAGIYKLSVLTGKSSKAVNDAMVGAFVATRNQLRVGVPFKATIAEAAKVSGQLAANLQNNPEQIVKAVVQAKALGTTLEQVKGQGEALLNFESSIESELKAELLTGKQLNLERARAAALAGDQVALAEELNKNVGSLEEFQKMNVIQQKTLAEAVGLTADQLAEQLRRQKLAVESGKSLAQITEEEAKQAQEKQNAQDKFNLAITKLQDLVGNLVAGPFGQLLDMVSSIATIILKIIQPFVSVAGAILNPILGGISGALGAMTGDDIVGYGARTLITPQGAIALNNNDTVIAGTNLSKGDDVISLPKGSLNLGGSGGSDVVNAIKDLKQTLVNRPAQAFIQGENAFVSRVTTKGVQNTYKSA
jgi:hypothetical protein